ncbi:hypothetical protein [Allonocardiopsis opalescens]|uniref:hypothetical protein n=1 Tax=Allonocardiopsis opalescens TaxID=1144618 RepID=UPI001473EDF5|nr:hypothetical protein [Allonocardiopsis opalescens]
MIIAPTEMRRVADAIRDRFFDQMCSAERDTVFFVGNQAKRTHVFSVLGIYYPNR